MKETPWFDGKVKPVHVGVYKRRSRDGVVIYSRWNGDNWCCGGKDFGIAAKNPYKSGFQRWPWCGLDEDPDQRRPGLNVIFEEVTREHPSWTVADRMAEAKARWDRKHSEDAQLARIANSRKGGKTGATSIAKLRAEMGPKPDPRFDIAA